MAVFPVKRLREDEVAIAHANKKPKLEHPPGLRYRNFPPAFYDCLDKVWLTTRALREVDRRARLESDNILPPQPQPCNELTRFARQGGPDLRDIRGYPEPELPNMPESHDGFSASVGEFAPTTDSSGPDVAAQLDLASTVNDTGAPAQIEPTLANEKKKAIPVPRRSSAYDKNFEIVLNKFNIFMPGHRWEDRKPPVPENMDDIRSAIRKRRPSLSSFQFDESKFDELVEKSNVVSEADVVSGLLPILAGRSSIHHASERQFSNLQTLTPVLTSAQKGAVAPKPDRYDGALLSSIHHRVRADLSKMILPTKNSNDPVVPNFFVEVKSDWGTVGVGKRQACYDGAHGARAMHSLQNYITPGTLTYNNMAYAYSVTLSSGTLSLYAHHMRLPPLHSPADQAVAGPEYHMTQINKITIDAELDQCIKGIAAYRNCRDRAKAERDAFIKAANDFARSRPDSPVAAETPSAMPAIPEDAVSRLAQDDDDGGGPLTLSEGLLEDQHSEPDLCDASTVTGSKRCRDSAANSVLSSRPAKQVSVKHK